MKFLQYSLAATSVSLMAGCASQPLIKSTPAELDKPNEGIVYSLPKQFVRVEYSRRVIDSTKAAAAQKKAKETVEEASKALKDKDSEINRLEATKKKVDPAAANREEVLAKLEMELTRAKAEKLVLTQTLAQKKQQFAVATMLYAQSLTADEAFNEEMKITPLSPVPDAALTFAATLQHKGSHSDTLELKTKNGLLDGAVGFSEDKTSAIIVSLASGIAGISQLPFGSNTYRFLPPGVVPAQKCQKGGSVAISSTVDPNDASGDMAALNEQLRTKACVELQIDPPDATVASIDSGTTLNGLAYRHPATFDFNIVDLNTNSVVQSFSINLAQGGPIGVINFPRGNLAKNEYDVAFTSGMLTKSKIIQPSEVLAAVMILPNALRAIFAIPTELIQLKVDYSSKEKELVELQKAMLEAQIAIETRQAELDALLSSETDP